MDIEAKILRILKNHSQFKVTDSENDQLEQVQERAYRVHAGKRSFFIKYLSENYFCGACGGFAAACTTRENLFFG